MTGPTVADGTTYVALRYPFHGQWMALNSPTRRVPSHGTHLFGTTYAIDFVGVDESGRTARWGWRAALASEPPESFAGFDRPILAPLAGQVVRVHDGEPDHGSRRSLPVGIPYALTQARRVRRGAAANRLPNRRRGARTTRRESYRHRLSGGRRRTLSRPW